MSSSQPGTLASSYVESVRVLNAFEKEQSEEFERLAHLQAAELSKIGQLVSNFQSLATDRSDTIQNAQQYLASSGIPADASPVRPPDFDISMTASHIVNVLNPITASVLNHASALPRLHTRHVGMQRDMVILPVFVLGLLLCLFMVVFSNPVLGSFYALTGGGLAAGMVQALGGGWTFRRLGGQDYTPQRPGQTAGKGGLAAFLVFCGIIFLLGGLFSLPGGWISMVLGIAMLVRPALRVRDVLLLEEQAAR